MKCNKILTSVVIAAAAFATVAEAGSIGRSGGGFSGGSRSSISSPSRSFSAPAPKAPSVAPAPSKPGGIGGTTSSVGVRKPEVTNSARNDVAATKPATPAGGFTSPPAPHYTPSPSYSYAPVPQPSVTNGSMFMSSLGGSLVGNMLGNALFNNHNRGSTTVINNGSGGGGSVSSGTATSPGVVSTDNQFNPVGVSTYKKEYTMWNFIGDVIGFVFLVAILVGVAWLAYKAFQLIRNYVQKERGVSTQPFNPTQRFWEIQKAFGAADVVALQTLLGPDVVDELTSNLEPSTINLHNVNHNVRLQNGREFSVWYGFTDDGAEVNQVWHYEKFGSAWKLNGIENI